METAKETETPGKPSRIKRTAKFLFNIPAWLGTENIADYSTWLKKIFLKTFAKPKKSDVTQTFAEAMAQQGLTEAELHQQLKTYARASWLFLGLMLASIAYMVYLWHKASIFVCLAGLTVIFILALKTYFYSFWTMQIKTQTLGCTFKNWLSWIFRGKI